MLKQVIQAYEILSDVRVSGDVLTGHLKELGFFGLEIKTFEEIAYTQFVKALVPGSQGKSGGGDAPTLGVIGNLAGLAAYPRFTGLVSDADGAITALAVLLKLIQMSEKQEHLKGDVILSTHICPQAPIKPHDPVPFMGNPTHRSLTKMQNYLDDRMEAIVQVETSRGNRVINWSGFAITPTIKECYVLKVSNDLLDIYQNVTGQMPRVVPVTTQDVTPYDNGLYHLNGLAQATVVSDAPIVGVALTSALPVPGCATGASQMGDIESAARFVLEVAKAYTAQECVFYDKDEFGELVRLYSSMKHLRKI